MKPGHWYEGRTSIDLLCGPDWAWIGLRSGDGLNRLQVDLLQALDRLFIELRWRGVQRVALSGGGWQAGRGTTSPPGRIPTMWAPSTPCRRTLFLAEASG